MTPAESATFHTRNQMSGTVQGVFSVNGVLGVSRLGWVLTVKEGGVLEGWVVPVEVLEPAVEVGVVVADETPVALEVNVVDGVVANNGGVETDIGLSEAASYEEVTAVGENTLYAVKRVDKDLGGLVVGILRGSETTLVDAIVDAIVDPLVESVNLATELLGVQVEFLLLALEERVERLSKVADNLRRLVRDNRLGLLVPEHGDSEAGIIVWVGTLVQVRDVVVEVELVGSRTRESLATVL